MSAPSPGNAGASGGLRLAGAASPVRRVLVVRGGRTADRVADACPPGCAVERTPGFLAGLAELLRGSADRLVGPADGLSGMEESMAATLSEAGLLGRVVVVDADKQTRAGFRDAGYPAVLAPDAPAGRFGAALGLDLGPEAPAAAADPASGDAAIGDSDLVEAIHDAGAGAEERLPGLVLRLLERESGIPGVGLAPAPDAGGGDGGVPPGHAWAGLGFRGESFGRLHAPPPADAAALAPWADWAARWLALGRQTLQLRELAMRDELTGVWNRRYFNRFLARILERAAAERQQVTLLVFDIDDFKSYNDLHGHAAGDAILAGAAQLMESTVRAHDVVARIGGDEFAVIFWDPRGRREEGSRHPDDVLEIARRFQEGVTDLRFPQLSAEAPGRLTISGGIAGFPWDGRTPAELLQKADLMALESKAQGKNAITLGAGLPAEEED